VADDVDRHFLANVLHQRVIKALAETPDGIAQKAFLIGDANLFQPCFGVAFHRAKS
jgi:hypothetical protein